MSEAKLITAGKYADIHKTGDGPPPTDDAKMQDDKPANSFWTAVNIRASVINMVVMAVIGCIAMYTTNLLTQQALAQRIDNIETKIDERKKQRDEDFKEMKADIKNTVVTKEVLELNLKPIAQAQAEQKQALGELKMLILQSRPNYSPNP